MRRKAHDSLCRRRECHGRAGVVDDAGIGAHTMTGKEARERARECGNARSRTLGKRSDDDRRVHGSEQAVRLPRTKPRDPARRAIEATQRKQAIEDAPSEPPDRDDAAGGSRWRQRLPALRSHAGPTLLTARPGCRPVSGLAGLDRLPSRATRAQWHHEAVRAGLPLRGQPRHAGRFSRSPHSRFISGDEFAANTCCSKFYRAPSRKSRSNAFRRRERGVRAPIAAVRRSARRIPAIILL